jgi:hypothetical protein
MSDALPDAERVAHAVRRVLGAESAIRESAEIDALVRELTALMGAVRAEERQRWRAVREVVDGQVEDGGIWFTAQTAPEAYLQQELGKLHAAIASSCVSAGKGRA